MLIGSLLLWAGPRAFLRRSATFVVVVVIDCIRPSLDVADLD
jgi:hypothetical protein